MGLFDIFKKHKKEINIETIISSEYAQKVNNGEISQNDIDIIKIAYTKDKLLLIALTGV